MLELILKSLLQSGPIGAVLAVMLWDSVQVKKKMFEVIENNTKAMTELKEEIHHQEKKKMSIPSDNTIVQKVSVFFTRQFLNGGLKNIFHLSLNMLLLPNLGLKNIMPA